MLNPTPLAGGWTFSSSTQFMYPLVMVPLVPPSVQNVCLDQKSWMQAVNINRYSDMCNVNYSLHITTSAVFLWRQICDRNLNHRRLPCRPPSFLPRSLTLNLFQSLPLNLYTSHSLFISFSLPLSFISAFFFFFTSPPLLLLLLFLHSNRCQIKP